MYMLYLHVSVASSDGVSEALKKLMWFNNLHNDTVMSCTDIIGVEVGSPSPTTFIATPTQLSYCEAYFKFPTPHCSNSYNN